jgi:hypothetical protein
MASVASQSITRLSRWVLRYAPVLNERIRSEMRNPNRSWRVDEMYIRVAGQWTYLYRAVDSAGTPSIFCRPRSVEQRSGIRGDEHYPEGQIRWLPKTDVVGQVRFIERTFGIAA